MDNRFEEQAEVLLDRAFNYYFLARFYREEVDVDLLLRMQEDLISDEGTPDLSDAASSGQKLLEGFMRSTADADLNVIERQLAAEYASLFLNVGKKPVYPFESVYTSSEKLVMQKAYDEVLAIYRQEGLGKTELLREPEDHIAIELEFMAYLCQRCAEALQAGEGDQALNYLAKQEGFLAEHLMVWVPAFCDDVEQAAKSDFYRGLAQLTREFLSMEQEAVASTRALIGEV